MKKLSANETQFTMYSDKLTLASTAADDDTLLTEFTCCIDVELAGDSLWDCELASARVTIVSIHTAETFSDDGDCISTHFRVMYTVNGEEEYENSWTLYTDSGFEEAVSDLFLTHIGFTEQGMQEDGYASMEFC